MNQWVIFPILIPAVVAPLLIVTTRYDLFLSRVFCLGANALMLLVSLLLVRSTGDAGAETYALGGWEAPYGIVLKVDSLAAMCLLLTSVVGVVVSLAAIDGEDERGRYFHALLLFQIMGTNGAFLTADLFNLFVFFEVMLLASYGLMVHGGGPARLRAGIQFVVINLVGSTLFLIGVGLVYGACGSLNLEDVARRLREVSESHQTLAVCGVALMMGVFAVKAALAPFHFWLPATYREAPPLVTALFAITSKVGVYAILRVGWAMGVWEAVSPCARIGWWMMPAALVTSIVGAIGVLAARRLGEQAAYATLASIGTLVIGVALANHQALVAALYYFLHSTLVGAWMFLVVALVQENRGPARDHICAVSWKRRTGFMAAAFLGAAMTTIGLPPLSGFVGKLLLLRVAGFSPAAVWIWGTILATSLLIMLGLTRAGIIVFWSGQNDEGQEKLRRWRGANTAWALGIVGGAILGITFAADELLKYLDQVAEELIASGIVQ